MPRFLCLFLVAATQRNTPWLPGSSRQQSLPARVPCDCNNEESSLLDINPRTQEGSGLKHMFFSRGLFAHPGALPSGVVLWFFTQKAYCGALPDAGWWTPSWSCPLPHSRSLISPGKELVHLSGTQILVAAMLGIPLDHLALVTHRADTCSLTLLDIFAYFNLTGDLVSNQLVLRCRLRSSMQGYWQVWVHPQLLGATWTKIGCLVRHKCLRHNQELGQGWTVRFISYTGPPSRLGEKVDFF